MARPVATANWRRPDQPGTDDSTLFADAAGRRLAGDARSCAGAEPSRLTCAVICGTDWRTRSASVTGHRAGRPVALLIEQGGGFWHVNGAAQPQVARLSIHPSGLVTRYSGSWTGTVRDG